MFLNKIWWITSCNEVWLFAIWFTILDICQILKPYNIISPRMETISLTLLQPSNLHPFRMTFIWGLESREWGSRPLLPRYVSLYIHSHSARKMLQKACYKGLSTTSFPISEHMRFVEKVVACLLVQNITLMYPGKRGI